MIVFSSSKIFIFQFYDNREIDTWLLINISPACGFLFENAVLFGKEVIVDNFGIVGKSFFYLHTIRECSGRNGYGFGNAQNLPGYLSQIVIFDRSSPFFADSIAIFKSWLANIIILSPNPTLFQSVSQEESSNLKKNGENLLDWLRHLLADHPNLYMPMSDFLKFRMPDFELFKFENLGKNSKELSFSFTTDSTKNLNLNFSQLSDGEKIYLLAATLIAKISARQPILCLWDEPNNFVSLIELNHFIMSCRKAFENDPDKSQIIMSTHASQVITEFSSNNTFIFHREAHFIPTQLELLSNKEYLSPTLLDAIENGEIL